MSLFLFKVSATIFHFFIRRWNFKAWRGCGFQLVIEWQGLLSKGSLIMVVHIASFWFGRFQFSSWKHNDEIVKNRRISGLSLSRQLQVDSDNVSFTVSVPFVCVLRKFMTLLCINQLLIGKKWRMCVYSKQNRVCLRRIIIKISCNLVPYWTRRVMGL